MDKENYKSITSKNKRVNRQPLITECQPQSHPRKQASAGKAYHDQYMKYLIASNAQYFQSKVRLAGKVKSKDVRFKIPCRTGMTIYRKDYIKKQEKFREVAVKHNMSTDCINTNNFLKDQSFDLRISNKTNYQKEFKYHPVNTQHCRKLKKRLATQNDDDNAPRFLQTQNKTDFLDWAGKNYVPSMRPTQKSAATNLPFQATTVYKSDFEAKNASPTPIFSRGSSYPNFGSVSMIMKSNYSIEYGNKRGSGCEISCKPKIMDASLCKQFKGTTQYKRQFIPNQKQSQQEEPFTTLENIQTLIIDL